MEFPGKGMSFLSLSVRTYHSTFCEVVFFWAMLEGLFYGFGVGVMLDDLFGLVIGWIHVAEDRDPT